MQIPPRPLVVEDSDDDALLLAILQSSLDCIVLVDALGRLVEFNPAAEATFGYTRAEVLGKPMADLLIPERLRGLHNEHFARYLATGERRTLGRRLEFDALRADGSEVPIELAIAVIRPAPHALFAGFMRDLTKRRHAEESERRFRVAMDNSADMFLLIDRATMRYVDFNPTACRLLGYSRDELLARGPQDVLPLSRAELEQSYDALIADPAVRGGRTSRTLGTWNLPLRRATRPARNGGSCARTARHSGRASAWRSPGMPRASRTTRSWCWRT